MATLEEVYSLLAPVDEARLLIPRLAIAEITGFSRPRAVPDEAPAWFLGEMPWHETTIPLISFEGLCKRSVPDITRRARVAVVNAIGAETPEGVFGLLIQGYPYLVRVNAKVLQPGDAEEAEPWEGPVLARPRMASETPMIPDLDAITSSVAALPRATQ